MPRDYLLLRPLEPGHLFHIPGISTILLIATSRKPSKRRVENYFADDINYFAHDIDYFVGVENYFTHDKNYFIVVGNYFTHDKNYFALVENYFSHDKYYFAVVENYFPYDKYNFALVENYFSLGKYQSINNLGELWLFLRKLHHEHENKKRIQLCRFQSG
ncbi:MAG: hypothetical protein ACP5G4_06355 [bacterium]